MIVEYDSFDREQEDGHKGKNYQALPDSGDPRKQRHNLREKGLQVRGARQAGAETHSSCINEYATRPRHPWGWVVSRGLKVRYESLLTSMFKSNETTQVNKDTLNWRYNNRCNIA